MAVAHDSVLRYQAFCAFGFDPLPGIASADHPGEVAIFAGAGLLLAWRYFPDTKRDSLVFGRHGRFLVHPVDVYLGIYHFTSITTSFGCWSGCIPRGCHSDSLGCKQIIPIVPHQ